MFQVRKLDKSSLRDDNIRFLASRIGNRTLVEKQGALCAGAFNSTLGIKVGLYLSFHSGNLTLSDNFVHSLRPT